MKEISVNDALRVGKKNASIRFAVPFYIAIIFSCITVLVFPISYYVVLISIPVGVLLSMYFTTKYLYQWQIWAFAHVRNVHELKWKAKKWGLIPGWESKLFPPSVRDSLTIQELQEKFNHADIAPDDSQVPEVFEIYYSKMYNGFEFICWSLGFVVASSAIIGLGWEADIKFQLFLGGIWLVTLYFSIENFIQLRTTSPVITLSSDGLRIKRRFFTKTDVKDIEIVDGKQKTLRVKFHVTKLAYPFDITDLDVDVNSFEDIAEVFVRRWKS